MTVCFPDTDLKLASLTHSTIKKLIVKTESTDSSTHSSSLNPPPLQFPPHQELFLIALTDSSSSSTAGGVSLERFYASLAHSAHTLPVVTCPEFGPVMKKDYGAFSAVTGRLRFSRAGSQIYGLIGDFLPGSIQHRLEGRNAWYAQMLAKGEINRDMGDNISGKGMIQGVSAVRAFYELLSQSSLSVLHPDAQKPVSPTVEALSSVPAPKLALRLYLQCAEAANDSDLEPVAYEFFTQAYILYEEEISRMHVFGVENRDTLTHKVTGYSAKLLKKPDQCRAVYACSQLFWVDDQDDVKDGERDVICRKAAS
ncbi:hypothetical protein ACFE04_021471 [Oxalis oulophora]